MIRCFLKRLSGRLQERSVGTITLYYSSTDPLVNFVQLLVAACQTASADEFRQLREFYCGNKRDMQQFDEVNSLGKKVEQC